MSTLKLPLRGRRRWCGRETASSLILVVLDDPYTRLAGSSGAGTGCDCHKTRSDDRKDARQRSAGLPQTGKLPRQLHINER